MEAPQALILSGGMGTRLRPLTLYSPKPLLPIANVPFLSYPLALLRSFGTRRATLCTSDSLEPYRALIRAEKKAGTTVACSRETQELGTAGAIKNAEKYARTESFFVLNGDVLTDIDLGAMIRFHEKKKAMITVALVGVNDPSAYGLALTDGEGRIGKFIEKPADLDLNSGKTYPINAGIYLFRRKVLDLIPAGRKYSSERELFPDCLARGLPVYGFLPKSAGYWLDIGTPQKFLQANADMLEGRLPRFRSLIQPPQLKKAVIAGDAVVHRDAVVGEGCRIGARSVLRQCVLLDRVIVEEDALVENCIVGGGSRIGHHVSITGSRALGNHSVITPYSKI